MNKNWLRTTIRDFEPYVVPEIKERIVINANESPYSIMNFPIVKEDFMERFKKLPSYHYPDPFANKLRQALAEYVGTVPEEILAGNGGDEIISLIVNTFINPGDTVLVHTPTFDIYEIDASVLGATIVKVPDLPGYKRDVAGILKQMRELQPKVTFICNPNNPTGELLPRDTIEEMIQASPNIVVIDEAYLEFAGQESVIPLLKKYDNLIVIRTLSKAFGLAGFRLGYGVANADIINALSLTKLSYNLNTFTQLIGEVALQHRADILKNNVPPTIEVREYLQRELAKLDGLTVYPSATNFILVKTPDGDRYKEALSRADICVRSYGSKADLKDCLRITVTTPGVANAVLAVFKKEANHA
jgi:histidinol-phosphate aminotransferase